jgi:hypothetical protein
VNVHDELKETVQQCKQLEAECRYSEAANVAGGARRLALQHEIDDEASAAGLTAAENLFLAGRDKEALELYFEVLNEPWTKASPAHVQYNAMRRVFDLMLDGGSDLASLRRRMRELIALAGACDPPAQADPHFYQATLAYRRGQFASALSGFERAFAALNGAHDFHRMETAVWGGYTCLQRNDRAGAERWWQAASTEKSTSLWGRVRLDAFRVMLLLFDNDRAADEAAERLEDATAGTSYAANHNHLRLRTRAALLIPDHGDPADPLHPARRPLRRVLAMEQSLCFRFSSRLLLVDYRLACVRHVAGAPPTDDLYYTCPDAPSLDPPPLGAEESLRRAAEAREALRKAWGVACRLDRAWRCSYYRREVLARRNRLRVLLGESRA